MSIKKLQAMKAKKGFTLVELIVVIAIIAVLAAILIPILMNYLTNSRISSANGDAKNIHSVVSGIIAELETKNKALPTANLTVTAAANTGVWTVTGGGASYVTTDIKNRMDADLLNYYGIGTVTISTAAANEGAATMVQWTPGKASENVYTKKQTRNNMYGVYPESKAGS